jgi:hypothetical protein
LRFIVCWLLILLLLSPAAAGPAELPDSLRVILAKYMRFTRQDLNAVQRGEVVKKALDTRSRTELVFFGITHVNAPPSLLIERFRDIETFKKGEAVKKVKKMNDPPSIEDFKDMTLEKTDLKELRKCKPGKCDMKLSTKMIDRIHREIKWTEAGQDQKATELFRTLLLEYVQDYLSRGNAGLIDYFDQKKPVSLSQEFKSIIQGSSYIRERLPDFYNFLIDYPRHPLPESEHFLYWSKETLKFRPVITITHVTIYRASPKEAFIASKQIFANHDVTGSLALTGMFSQNEDLNQPGFYLFYLNRTRTDMLGGLLSGLKRSLARSRSTAALDENLTLIKQGLEKEFASRD